MSWFSFLRPRREKDLAEEVQELKDLVNAQNELIKNIIHKVSENREGLNELGDLMSFALQQQAEISSFIGLAESVKKGKFVPSTISLLETDDDLIN